MKITHPSSNKSFAFIREAGNNGGYLDISASGTLTIITRMFIDGDKHTLYYVTIRTKGSSFLREYDIDIENAIAAGEIKSFIMTSDEALSELKKCKDKLDIGLITQEKYDSIKAVLVKFIKL